MAKIFMCVYIAPYTSLAIHLHFPHVFTQKISFCLRFSGERNFHQQYSVRRREKVMESQNKNNPQNLATHQITALVVDDNALNRKIHQQLLNSAGVKNVQVAGNGKEAVDIHRRGQRFHLILMDRDMPIMNGVEATKELRSMGICSMIVGVSSRDTEVEIQNFMEAGLDDYQEKPLKSAKLSSILDKIKPNFNFQ